MKEKGNDKDESMKRKRTRTRRIRRGENLPNAEAEYSSSYEGYSCRGGVEGLPVVEVSSLLELLGDGEVQDEGDNEEDAHDDEEDRCNRVDDLDHREMLAKSSSNFVLHYEGIANDRAHSLKFHFVDSLLVSQKYLCHKNSRFVCHRICICNYILFLFLTIFFIHNMFNGRI